MNVRPDVVLHPASPIEATTTGMATTRDLMVIRQVCFISRLFWLAAL